MLLFFPSQNCLWILSLNTCIGFCTLYIALRFDKLEHLKRASASEKSEITVEF